MAEKTVKALPLVPAQYDSVNESINRRTIEQALQDLYSEVGHVKDMQESGISKAVKRHIFLLMGASHCCFNGGSISMMLTALAGIKLPDNEKIFFGNSNDMEIYHDGSNSYIKDAGTGSLRLRGTDLRLESSTLAHNFIVCTEGGGVTVYHNDSSKLSTTSTGINVTGVITTDGLTTSADINFGDNDKAVFGAGSDLEIHHDGSNSIIKNTATGNLIIRNAVDDGDVILQSDDDSGGVTNYITLDGSEGITKFGRNAKFNDSKVLNFGDSNDLQIYHDGSNSYIKDAGTGLLSLITDGSDIRLVGNGGSDFMARFNSNSSVQLYYDNALKLATTSTGVDVTGKITATNVNADIKCIAIGYFVGTTGASNRASGISCTRNSVGDYTITFSSARPDANYIIHGQVVEPTADRDDTKIHVVGATQSTTSFDVNIYEGDNGTNPDVLRDRDFYITVMDVV